MNFSNCIVSIVLTEVAKTKRENQIKAVVAFSHERIDREKEESNSPVAREYMSASMVVAMMTAGKEANCVGERGRSPVPLFFSGTREHAGRKKSVCCDRVI
jgi:hypothetical protein